MTTTIKVQVGGNYHTTVTQIDAQGARETVIMGKADGQQGEATFYLPHPASGDFSIRERQMTADEIRDRDNPSVPTSKPKDHDSTKDTTSTFK